MRRDDPTVSCSKESAPESATDALGPTVPSDRRGPAPPARRLGPDDETAGAGAEGADESVLLPERYRSLRLLGSGGFGEVRRVLDRHLSRVVAMKMLRPDIAEAPKLRQRFLTEVKLTAGLHHPGIIAIHDYGEIDDGRLWFTMPEVRGRTLLAVIREVYAQGAPIGPDAAVQRRRLLDLFARVCDAVAYAHSRGVIHRDLKPENIMVGEFGEVMVMDWGIARRTQRFTEDDEEVPTPPPMSEEMSLDGLTRHGDIIGTPAYMSPEQTLGDLHRLGPTSDVYALGATLFYLLTGRPPFTGTTAEIWRKRLGEGPPAITDPQVPADLVAICRHAMARDPDERYPDAGKLGADIEAFLSGARRREHALEKLAEARSRSPAITATRARAAELRARAATLLAPTKPSDPVESKLPGWEAEDEAERLEREAALDETSWIEGVHGAIAIDPDLVEAHEALADHYRAKLVEAERARRHDDAARCEVLLRAHDRGQHAAFLSGLGRLTLVTDPPGARVLLERYTLRRRRLVPEIVGDIGPTPIVGLSLETGSYRLRITAPGREEVKYPVLIERGEAWDGCPPGSAEPWPIALPKIGEVGDDEVYVPAGWGWIGGDPEAPDSLPATRVWIDGLVVGRFPVTNEEYLVFLNDLVAAGREEEALLACPRATRGLIEGADSELSYDRGPDGRFRLKTQDVRWIWTLRSPAVLMSWHGAVAYARWRAARTGLPYRLLNELEREKAVRGVDRRLFPWGDFCDPTWACMLNSHTGDPQRADVDAYPLDESPYGLRGGAGNSHDTCINVWTQEGPTLVAGRLVVEAEPPGGEDFRSVRGGSWSSVAGHCRAAARFAIGPDQRLSATGLRVGRSYPC